MIRERPGAADTDQGHTEQDAVHHITAGEIFLQGN